LLSDHEKVAYTVLFHPHSNYTAYREYRLFRNDPRIRFKGVIRETMVPAIQLVASEDNLEIGECDLTIQHLGYDSDQQHKHRRNLPLLQKQVKKDPERIYCWWNLGTALAGLGKIREAEKAWKNGINVIRNKKKVHPADSQPYAELIRSRYKRGKDIADLLEEALSMFPDQYLLIWLKGMILKEGQQYEEAVPFFRKLADIDTGYVDGGVLAYDSRMFDIFSYEPLAECYYKLGMYKESTACYSLAEQCDPSNQELKIKRQFTAARARQL
jgi:tetratricopeptide (TPR) repeat protein